MPITYARFKLLALLQQREQQALKIPALAMRMKEHHFGRESSAESPAALSLGRQERPEEGKTLHHSSPPAALPPPFC